MTVAFAAMIALTLYLIFAINGPFAGTEPGFAGEFRREADTMARLRGEL